MEEVSRKKAKCNEGKQFTRYGVPKNSYKDGQDLVRATKNLVRTIAPWKGHKYHKKELVSKEA